MTRQFNMNHFYEMGFEQYRFGWFKCSLIPMTLCPYRKNEIQHFLRLILNM